MKKEIIPVYSFAGDSFDLAGSFVAVSVIELEVDAIAEPPGYALGYLWEKFSKLSAYAYEWFPFLVFSQW